MCVCSNEVSEKCIISSHPSPLHTFYIAQRRAGGSASHVELCKHAALNNYSCFYSLKRLNNTVVCNSVRKRPEYEGELQKLQRTGELQTVIFTAAVPQLLRLAGISRIQWFCSLSELCQSRAASTSPASGLTDRTVTCSLSSRQRVRLRGGYTADRRHE